ncbi:hypothetical protein [Actinokineospora sp. NPDC004072]
MATVSADDLRALLDSPLPDAVLVLREGRVEVAAGADRAGMEIITRADLLSTPNPSDDDLERRAATLTATTDIQGG